MQALKSRFLRNTPSLEELKKSFSIIVKDTGTLPGLDGRRLQVRSDRAALNTLLQSAGAIVMKQALINLDEELKSWKIDYKFVANVHDEWQVEVEERYAELAGRLGVMAIEKSGKDLTMRCPLSGEYKIGNSWRETH